MANAAEFETYVPYVYIGRAHDSSVAVGNLRPTVAAGFSRRHPPTVACHDMLGLIQHPGTDGWDPYYYGRQHVHAARHGRISVGMSVSGNREVEMYQTYLWFGQGLKFHNIRLHMKEGRVSDEREMKFEGVFHTRDLGPAPLLWASLAAPPDWLENFQPPLAFKLDIIEMVYSFDRGILKIK